MINLPKSHQLTTARFRLRIPNAEDIPRIFSATRFEGFNDGMQWDPPEHQEALMVPLKHTIQAWEAGKGFSFTITARGDSTLLGRISIRPSQEENVWNVGFWTHPESQRQGIMTESLAAILRFGFEDLGAIRIEACHAVWNKASQSVLEKNGMQFVRWIAEGFQKRGEWVAENLLAINRAEWEKA